MSVSSPMAQAPSQNGLSRRAIVAAFVLSTLFTAVVTIGSNYYSNLWQQKRAERIAEVGSFLTAAQQFDFLVEKFMVPFLKGADDHDQREALRTNVHTQHELLETAKASLSGDQAAAAERYEEQLVRVATQLDNGQPAPLARDLIQAIADARNAKVDIVYQVRKSAGLPVGPVPPPGVQRPL